MHKIKHEGRHLTYNQWQHLNPNVKSKISLTSGQNDLTLGQMSQISKPGQLICFWETIILFWSKNNLPLVKNLSNLGAPSGECFLWARPTKWTTKVKGPLRLPPNYLFDTSYWSILHWLCMSDDGRFVTQETRRSTLKYVTMVELGFLLLRCLIF